MTATPRAARRVTVVMAVPDARPGFEDAIHDLLAQTYEPLELVVVDAGAGIAATVERVAPDAIVVGAGPVGEADALNRGVQAATGDVVATMDPTDRTDPDRVARLASLLAEGPRLSLVGTGVWLIDGESGRRTPLTPPADDLALQRAMLSLNWFTHGSVAFPRQAFDEVGGYRSEFAPAHDYDLFLRLCEVGAVAVDPAPLHTHVPDRGAGERAHEQRLASARARQAAIDRRSGGYDESGGRLNRAAARRRTGAPLHVRHHLAWARRLARQGQRLGAMRVAAAGLGRTTTGWERPRLGRRKLRGLEADADE